MKARLLSGFSFLLSNIEFNYMVLTDGMKNKTNEVINKPPAQIAIKPNEPR